MSFVVALSSTAETAPERRFDGLRDQADTTEGLDRAQAAIDDVGAAAQHGLSVAPFSFRNAAHSPAPHESITPLGGTGRVALHEVKSASKVVMLAVRHQQKGDCH